MSYKITKNDANIVIDALHEYQFDNDFFINKVKKALTKYDELKEKFIEEKMYRIRNFVPYGHCPYGYYSFDNGVECGDLECDECKRRYFEDFEKQLRKNIDEEF